MFSLPHEEEQVALLMKEGKYSDAIFLLEEIVPQFESAEAWEKSATYLNLSSKCLWHQEKFNESIKKAEQALMACLYVWGDFHDETAWSYNHLGIAYYSKGNVYKAIKYYLKSLDIRRKIFGDRHHHIAGCYLNLGACYNYNGDYMKAIAYYQQAISIFIETMGEDHFYVGYCFANLGGCYSKKKDFDLAIYFNQKAKSIFLKTSNEQNRRTAICDFNISGYYSESGDNILAIDYLQKAHTFFLANKAENAQSFGRVLNNFGYHYLEELQYSQAVHYFEQALSLKLELYGETHQSITLSYLGLARTYQAQYDFPQTFYYLQKSFQSLALPVKEDDYYVIPELLGYNSALDVLEVLTDKGKAFFSYFHNNNILRDLVASIAHFQSADEMIDQIRIGLKAEGSKLNLAEYAKNLVYSIGLDICWTAMQLKQIIGQENFRAAILEYNQSLNYHLPDSPLEIAFFLSEKSKGFVLFTSMKDSKARITAGIPSELVQQEYDLRIEQTYLEQKLIEEKQMAEEQQDKLNIKEWQNSIFESKQQYEILIEHLEKEFPDYYRLKYDLKVANILEIQTALTPETALVSYVLTDKYLYSFVINATGSQWLQQLLPASFEGLIEDFLYSFEPLGKEDYHIYGFDLYLHLILPLEENGWLNGINRLVIIPDGILSRLPFEALLTKAVAITTPYEQLPYLLKRYVISYHYSATLWFNQQMASKALHDNETKSKEAKEVKHDNRADFIGFAPIYSNSITASDEHDIDLTFEADFVTT